MTIRVADVSREGIHRFHCRIDASFDELLSGNRDIWDEGERAVWDEFRDASYELFDAFYPDEMVPLCDRYFENLTPIFSTHGRAGNHGKALATFEVALGIATDWESDRARCLHKGTPYYFAAEAALLSHDVDYGIPLMYLAYQEDQSDLARQFDREGPSPAEQFFSLDHDREVGRSHFHVYLKLLADYLETEHLCRMADYALDDFRRDFFVSERITVEQRARFLHVLIRLFQLRGRIEVIEAASGIAAEVFTDAISPLFLLLDDLLLDIFPQAATKKVGERRTFCIQMFVKDLHGDGPDIDTSEKARQADFAKWLARWLDDTRAQAKYELLHGLRNTVFHTADVENAMWYLNQEIEQALMDCMFAIARQHATKGT